ARAALRWVALSALVGADLFVVPLGLAPLMGGAPPLPQGLGFVFFLIMYAGIALGVARFRLFDLDEWAYRILLWVSGVLLLLLVDAALIWLLHLAPALSLGVSLLIVGFLYLPLRNWFWRRLVTRHGLSEDALFRGVLEVVLEPDDRRRTVQWRNLLQRLFQPLEIRVLDEPLAAPVLRDDGLTLDVPAVAGAPALRLRYPWQGRGLFSRDYLRLARRLMAFMAQADASRVEFARGVAEERQRITRDLHDDIASRLISSLHQAQDPLIKRTLRNTLQDLRTILSGLAGESMSLDGLLERLREEADERLGAANIGLEWQVPDALPDWPMEYPIYKNLLSVQREIVSNILRHSHAALVRITVALEGDGVCFTTTDFRMADALAVVADADCETPGSGLGMANMQQRLAQIHGTVEHHEHEEGHAVSLWVPLRSPQMAPPLLS
ncbi:MAG: sensor histidine kinase, partial [Pigmentiphaga sp.]